MPAWCRLVWRYDFDCPSRQHMTARGSNKSKHWPVLERVDLSCGTWHVKKRKKKKRGKKNIAEQSAPALHPGHTPAGRMNPQMSTFGEQSAYQMSHQMAHQNMQVRAF
jgi:hypothetical protein